MSSTAKLPAVDKIYKIKNSSPLSFTLPSRDTRQLPLLYFDKDQGVNRALRYSINQKSPFIDQQDGNAIVEPIVFEDGFLRVPKENPVLQEFLFYHPMNGRVFEEVDHEKDAAKEVEKMDLEADAVMYARNLTLEQMETMARVLFGKDPSRMSSAELKRDIRVFARKDPKVFLDTLNDPSLTLNSNIHKFFEAKLLVFRNNQKEIWFNLASNKRKLMTIPYGDDPHSAATQYFSSEEGMETLKMLEELI